MTGTWPSLESAKPLWRQDVNSCSLRPSSLLPKENGFWGGTDLAACKGRKSFSSSRHTTFNLDFKAQTEPLQKRFSSGLRGCGVQSDTVFVHIFVVSEAMCVE